jgi:Na+-transporting NADH:ubiquinone oxidoreductase subunit C
MTPKTRERLFTVWFMLATTVVVVSAVSGAYLLTEARVRLNEALYLKRAVLAAAGLDVPAAAAEVEALYGRRVVDGPGAPGTYAVRGEDGQPAGVVVMERGAGLWGTIRAAVGFDLDGSRLTGIEFVEQNETPGLGARIGEAWFRQQFRGRQPPLGRVPEGTAARTNEFDAITGATITSAAVEGIVNRSAARAKRPAGPGRGEAGR